MTREEQLLKAKIPCPETQIEIRKSICDICTGVYCGLDVYVKDRKAIKVEGTPGFPGNPHGKLCTKGASTRSYVYREDRLTTPLRRTGPRGSGQFEAISWDEAYREIAARLNRIKEIEGPDAVAWFTGYTKWFRPWLHRIAHSFGTRNYGTESSVCFTATSFAWKTIAGRMYKADMARSQTYVGWGCNTLVNFHTRGRQLTEFHERGGKIIIIDPRITPTARRLADIHLQLRPGTDGALALGMANVMLERGWYNREFVEKYVHGFEQYRQNAQKFTLEETERLTGVPAAKIEEAAELYANNGPVSTYLPAAAVTHHINGFNNIRAAIALQVITGNIDCPGGELPGSGGYLHVDTGFETLEKQFVEEVRPTQCQERIGEKRFPLWSKLINEFQASDLARQIEEGEPYPLKAIMAFGMNHRMFPQSQRVLKAIESLDFVVAADLVMTDLCRSADIVLPVCSSLERSELRGFAGGFMTCTTPAIPPLGDSKLDTVILCELARYLELDDDLLKSGYENTMRYIISNLSETLEELREADLPLKVKGVVPYVPGTMRQKGFETKTGKLELYSEIIAELQPEASWLDPVTTYQSSFDDTDPAEFPLTLITGARLPNAIHSRFHNVPWARSLRQNPAADLHPADATALGIKENDTIELRTQSGAIRVKAHLTACGLRGDVYMYHGYPEADVNLLIPDTHLDLYTGFVGFRQIRCAVRKVEENDEAAF